MVASLHGLSANQLEVERLGRSGRDPVAKWSARRQSRVQDPNRREDTLWSLGLGDLRGLRRKFGLAGGRRQEERDERELLKHGFHLSLFETIRSTDRRDDVRGSVDSGEINAISADEVDSSDASSARGTLRSASA